jgi:hypothetical protein
MYHLCLVTKNFEIKIVETLQVYDQYLVPVSLQVALVPETNSRPAFVQPRSYVRLPFGGHQDPYELNEWNVHMLEEK